MRKQLAAGDVLIISLGAGKTRPYQVRIPLTKHLNRNKVVVVTATLVHHIEAKVVEVELAFVTNMWPSMVAREKYMQRDKSTQRH